MGDHTTSIVPFAKFRLGFEGSQVRAKINRDTVADYAEQIGQGREFPPPVVYFDGETYWPADGHHRIKLGYAVELTVREHPADGKVWKDTYGNPWFPCKEETEGKACVECQFCFDADKRGAGVAFAAHGQGKSRVRETLYQLSKKPTPTSSSVATEPAS